MVSLKALAAKLSPVALLNGLAGSAAVAEETGIAYGSLPRHRLDVYRPRDAGPHPVAVFFYGGGWEEGERNDYRFVGTALAAAGILTIIPDYRVYPEVRFDGFMQDAARAVRWAADHAAGLEGDPGRLVLLGHSAGAHIAGMLALDTKWLDEAGVPQSDVRGWIGLAGPYDFSPDTPNRLVILGTDRFRTQPIGFARPDAPPALLATGERDGVVDPGNATRLARRLTEVGASGEVKTYPLVDHGSILGAYAPILRFLGPVFRDSLSFIHHVTADVTRRQSEAA